MTQCWVDTRSVQSLEASYTLSLSFSLSLSIAPHNRRCHRLLLIFLSVNCLINSHSLESRSNLLVYHRSIQRNPEHCPFIFDCFSQVWYDFLIRRFISQTIGVALVHLCRRDIFLIDVKKIKSVFVNCVYCTRLLHLEQGRIPPYLSSSGVRNYSNSPY